MKDYERKCLEHMERIRPERSALQSHLYLTGIGDIGSPREYGTKNFNSLES
jgi:hypothetical protein